jgi:hypothetical protein
MKKHTLKSLKMDILIAQRMNEIKLPQEPQFDEFVRQLQSGQFVLLVKRCPCCGNANFVQSIPLKPNDE